MNLSIWGREYHRADKMALRKSWASKMAPILDHLLLDKLVIDLNAAACPDLCFYMDASAIASLGMSFACGPLRTLIMENSFESIFGKDFINHIVRHCTDARAYGSKGLMEDMLGVRKLREGHDLEKVQNGVWT